MITSEATFLDLHEAIQDACGWRNSHLFRFQDEKGRVLAVLPGDEDDEAVSRPLLHGLSQVLFI